MSTYQGLPTYLIGLHHKLCTVVGLTRSTAGLYTPDTGGSSADLVALAVFNDLSHERTKNTADIRPTNSSTANNVALSQDFDAEVTEILQPNIPSRLKAIANAFGYAGITFAVTPDAGTTVNTLETIVGLIVRDSVRYDVEKHTVTLSLKACGVATF